MVDTYSKSAENRKLYKKNHGDGEDPIIIAQRFLNIFRQLHIFSAERKEAFNKMILEQPPEIRGMFGSLPGGSLLQEYVDELEQNAGVTRDHSGEFQHTTTSPELNDEISRAKILATALAEAQIQANAKLQNNIPPAQPQPAAASAPQAMAPTYAGPAKIVADASFAKEIAAAFSQALKFSEERSQTGNKQLAAAVIVSQEKMANLFAEKNNNSELTSSLIATQEKMAQALAENAAAIKNLPIKSLASGKETSFSAADSSKEILDAIKESQDRMAQMIMQHNTMAASNSSNNNANNIQINAAPMPPMEDIVKGIVKAQSELFREMSATQTKELSAIISVALKESQQLSTQTIVEAMDRMQKENQKFFEQQTKNASKVTLQPVYIASETHKPQTASVISEEKDDFQIPEVNPAADNNTFTEFSADTDNTTTEESAKKKKKKKKKKNKNNDSDSENSGLDLSLFDDGIQATTKLKEEIKNGLSSLASSIFKKDEKADNIDLTDIAVDTPHDEPLPALSSDPTPAETVTENGEPADEDAEWAWEAAPAEETTTAEPDSSVMESAEPADEDEALNEDFNLDDLIAEYSKEQPPMEELTDKQENPAEEVQAADTSEDSDLEWEYEEVPEDEVGTPKENPTEEVQAADTSEDGDWEWEYEEVPEGEDETPAENPTEEVQAADTGTATDTSEDGDWEWEYEEVPEGEDETPAENPTEEVQTADTDTAAEASEDGDWEWEYEEVPENEVETPAENLTKEVQAADTGTAAEASEDGDWEWEYEEVPEGEDETPSENPTEEVQAADTGTATEASEDSDWEWEYEEVPEDEVETPAENLTKEVQAADTHALQNDEETANPLYNSDLIFHDDVYKDANAASPAPVDAINLGIAEIGDEKENKEPYIPKDDIIG